MRKTTVYLSDEEAEGLRRLAAETKQAQAELLRHAVRSLLTTMPQRRFHSMGVGASGGTEPRRWSTDELNRKVRGED